MLRRELYQENPKRYEYILTEKGLDLFPVFMSLVHWGDAHMAVERGRPLLHEHKHCGHTFDPVLVCSNCPAPVIARDVRTRPGPGAVKHAETRRGGKNK